MKFDYLSILSTLPFNFNCDHNSFIEQDVVVSIGKSAFFMYEKLCEISPDISEKKALLIMPENTPCGNLPDNCTLFFSTHPYMSEKSFEAGSKLIQFLKNNKSSKATVLLSGGSSSLVEYSEDPKKTIAINRNLLTSGCDILSINKERIKYSDIKGGKLARMFPEIFFTVFVMSDIPFKNGEFFVGSMPFYEKDLKNCWVAKCADSDALHGHIVDNIKDLGKPGTVNIKRFNKSVNNLYEIIKNHIYTSNENLIITGEPVLKIENRKNIGNGGRMSHLALMLLPHIDSSTSLYALSSDGIDGNSVYAGAVIEKDSKRVSKDFVEQGLENYDSANVLSSFGYSLKTGYTGINLNDFVIVIKS
jgi:glycerate 2-kinase